MVITPNTRDRHEHLLVEIHHVNYLQIDSGDLVDYLTAIKQLYIIEGTVLQKTF